MWGFGFQYSFVVFGASLLIYFLRSGFEFIFKDFNFKVLDFEVKMISSKYQKVTKAPKHNLTNRGVIWIILKTIKISD